MDNIVTVVVTSLLQSLGLHRRWVIPLHIWLSLHTSQIAHLVGAFPGFYSMKRLKVAQEHNTMFPARFGTRTYRSGDERVNHEVANWTGGFAEQTTKRDHEPDQFALSGRSLPRLSACSERYHASHIWPWSNFISFHGIRCSHNSGFTAQNLTES